MKFIAQDKSGKQLGIFDILEDARHAIRGLPSGAKVVGDNGITYSIMLSSPSEPKHFLNDTGPRRPGRPPKT